MTNREREYFCALLASLLVMPVQETIEELKQDEVRSFLAGKIREWTGDLHLLQEFLPEEMPEKFLPVLQREYSRLFNDLHGEKISLAESVYKPWTADRQCGLAFAGAKGLLLGDYALHMREMYRRLSLTVPEQFHSAPDHLALELEFLSLLYGAATEDQIQEFIADHLDWLGELQERVDRSAPHPFYRHALGLVQLFLTNEKKGGKARSYEPQNLH